MPRRPQERPQAPASTACLLGGGLALLGALGAAPGHHVTIVAALAGLALALLLLGMILDPFGD